MIEQLKVSEELKGGGEWLGAARRWMQGNIKDGDTMPWSSTKAVQIPFFSLEDFARKVAIAAVVEERKRAKREDKNKTDE